MNHKEVQEPPLFNRKNIEPGKRNVPTFHKLNNQIIVFDYLIEY